jgi:hypothetical protein
LIRSGVSRSGAGSAAALADQRQQVTAIRPAVAIFLQDMIWAFSLFRPVDGNPPVVSCLKNICIALY